MASWTENENGKGDEGVGIAFDLDAADGISHAICRAASPTLGDLPGFHQLGLRFAREARDVFAPILRRQPRIDVEPVRVERFGDYSRRLRGGLMNLTLVDLAPVQGQALVVLEPTLILHAADLYFGGSGTVPDVLPAEFSPTEQAITDKMVGGMIERLVETWKKVQPMAFHPVANESSPRLLNYLGPDEQVVVTRFSMTLADGQSTPIDIVYPLSALKPVLAKLGPPLGGPAAPENPRWSGALARAVMNVPLPVRSVLTEPVVPLSVLANLKPGDIIPIELDADIPLLIQARAVARGTVGQSGGKVAVKVDRMIPNSTNEDDQ